MPVGGAGPRNRRGAGASSRLARLGAVAALAAIGALSPATSAEPNRRGGAQPVLAANERDDAPTASQPNNARDLFPRIATVLLSPRCLNCHTTTDFPRQGDDRHPHLFGVLRGADDRGVPWARCTSCHGLANNNATGIPGRPDWHLAPLSMEWERLSAPELCHRLLARANNGNRSPAQIVDHVVNDHTFVEWSWSPGRRVSGEKRSVPPIPRPEFNHLVEQWVAAGAPCPQ